MKKEKTKVGKFLQGLGGSAISIVKNIASGDNPIDAILGAFNGGKISKENTELALKFHQEDLQDVQNARANETARDTNENTPLLSKLIHEIIALFVVGSWVVSWFVTTTIATIEVTGAVMLILGYLFGRSRPQ